MDPKAQLYWRTRHVGFLLLSLFAVASLSSLENSVVGWDTIGMAVELHR
jgi:predicted ABC-type transport system involved in lysophospholipase L1 biosynthesis ATPase subunit